MKNNYREELINSMKELSKEGFKCFILKEKPGFMYGYIVTPSDNIIYVQRDSFAWRGWTFSFKYVPSQKTGNACQCLEEPVETITKDIILQAEKEGLQFARKLKATLYKSSEEYFSNKNHFWNPSEFEEITAE